VGHPTSIIINDSFLASIQRIEIGWLGMFHHIPDTHVFKSSCLKTSMGEDQTKLHLKEYLGELQGKRGAFSNKGIGQLITTLCSSMSSIPYPDEKLLFIHEKLDLFRLQITA
jgi:hypothetical protein